MRNPNLGQSSPDGRNVAMTRALLGSAFAASMLVLGQSNSGCSYASEAADAASVNQQYETLLGVKAFLQEKGDKIKYYASMGDEEMAKHAPQINAILIELTGQLTTAKGVADSISETDVRFNPFMFADLKASLETAIRKVSPSDPKMRRLFEAAADMRRSKNNWGIKNWLTKKTTGINPDAVIRMSSLIVKLRGILIGLDKSVARLSKDGIGGCSDNSFVEKKIIEKFGNGHCDEGQVFCQAMAGAGYENFDPKNVKFDSRQAFAIQRKLISNGLLGIGEDDGKFGSGSKDALSRAKKSNVFLDQVKKCRNR